MRVVIDPPADQWPLEPNHPVATGHQAWLWHPGILAKDIAASIAAAHCGRPPIHLVVDHDVHEALRLSVPVIRNDRLSIETLSLGRELPNVPAGCQPAASADPMRQVLIEARDRLGAALAVDLQPLIDAIEAVSSREYETLAQQIAALTAMLMRPYVGEVTLCYSSQLLSKKAGGDLVRHMLNDAARCAGTYNDAVGAFPHAGVSPLRIERERVELPLWNLRWGQPRQRVFADLADAGDPILIEEDGTPIAGGEGGEEGWLAPKALLLTAVMRTQLRNPFIHGMGGGIYDQVMERWWGDWAGDAADALAPKAVVTADLYLDFDAPSGGREQFDRAVWFNHHLPHNIDRVLHVNGQMVQEKRQLLAAMDDDRDKARRSAAFDRLHRINAQLVAQHPEAIRDADDQLRQARLGMDNAALAHKRDWCFALYPPEKLLALRRKIEQSLSCRPDGAVV